MKWQVVVVGKPALGYVREGVETYVQRLRRLAKVEIHYLKAAPAAEIDERVLAMARGGLLVLLDERGELPDTAGLVATVNAWEQSAVRNVVLAIGGADGHSAGLRSRAEVVWALGRITLQHELALLVWMEQLYRIYSVKKGMPYHREG